MKVLDFLKFKPVQEIEAEPRQRHTDPSKPKRESIKHLIEDPEWGFTPVESRTFTSDSIQNAAAIYSAQQMRRIADDIEVIRKHMTRLQLIAPKDSDV